MTKRKILTRVLATFVMLIFTTILHYPLGGFGYLNFSDAIILLVCTHLDPGYAMVASGLSCVLSDIILGYSNYALATLLIKGLEGFLVSYITRKKRSYLEIVIVCGSVMLIGYGIFDAFELGSLKMMLESLQHNFIQFDICVISALLINPKIQDWKDQNIF